MYESHGTAYVHNLTVGTARYVTSNSAQDDDDDDDDDDNYDECHDDSILVGSCGGKAAKDLFV